MTLGTSPFYITGGTLHPNAPCYVERNADRRLYQRLQRGDFCYVLTSRQMGKSSLMVRCASRLRGDGATVVALDLTAIGQNLTAEQWYDGLALRLGQQTRLEEQLERFWQNHPRLGAAQRFFAAIREVVLPKLAAEALPNPPKRPGGDEVERAAEDLQTVSTQLVVFVDEIDTVRSLAFSTDEFFAAIRECYNRRVEDPLFNHLSFCLLGVATPSDLIRDTKMTPFNIGHRVELNDFTEEEAAPLAQGLGRDADVSRPLLKRIYFWTHGHPYLTQRMCQAVALDSTIREPRDVDRVCHDLFLTHRARERDDNLLFVRDRILRSGAELAGLLTLYDRARRGKCPMNEDQASGLLSVLRLSGIVRVTERWCLVRNRIYREVFDEQWVRANMPDAELQRQRSAYRRGILWSSSIAAVIIAVLALVISYAFQQSYLASTANSELAQASHQTAVINQKLVKTLRELRWQNAEELLASGKPGDALAYFAHFLRLETNNVQMAIRALSVLNQNNFALPVIAGFRHGGPVLSAEFSPDETLIATGSEDGKAQVWNARTGQPVSQPLMHKGPVSHVAFSPDGQLLVTASQDTNARIWSVQSGKLLHTLTHKGTVLTAAFSPNGKLVVTGSGDTTARVWDPEADRSFAVQHTGSVNTVAFSRDGRAILTPSGDRAARLWDAATGAILQTFGGHDGRVRAAEFSPDGELVVTASDDHTAQVYDVRTGARLSEMRHKGGVRMASFSPDGSRIATASDDQTARVWDARTGLALCAPLRHKGRLVSVEFSSDGHRLVTGCRDGTARVWKARTGELLCQPLKHGGEIVTSRFRSDGRQVLTASRDGFARLWDILPGQQLVPALQHTAEVRFAEFSPDGQFILTSSSDRTAQLWKRDSATPLHSHPLQQGGRVRRSEFSPDGRLVATASSDNQGQIWDVASGEKLGAPLQHLRNVLRASFSPDSRKVITTSSDRTAKIWEVSRTSPPVELRGHDNPLTGAEFSPDGRWVVTSSADHTARLWDPATGREVWRFSHSGSVTTARFAPQGPYLATGSDDKTAVIWDYQARQCVAVLVHPGPVLSVEFSPNGRTLATTDARSSRLWDVPSGQLRTKPLVHEATVWTARFNHDGRLLVTASEDQTARLWDVLTGQPLSEPMRCEGTVFTADFSPDGHWIVTASSDRTARVWENPGVMGPPPPWLADLVEGVAGQRFNDEGSFLEPIPPDRLVLLKARLLETNEEDAYTRWGRWFFADRAERTISPMAPMLVREYVSRKIRQGTFDGLLEAALWPFEQGLIDARLAAEILQQTENPSRELEADWYSAKAVKLAPEIPEVWTARARCVDSLGRVEEAAKAVDEALRRNPEDATANFLRGKLYWQKGEWEKALAALNHSLVLDRNNAEAERLKEELLQRLKRDGR